MFELVSKISSEFKPEENFEIKFNLWVNETTISNKSLILNRYENVLLTFNWTNA